MCTIRGQRVRSRPERRRLRRRTKSEHAMSVARTADYRVHTEVHLQRIRVFVGNDSVSSRGEREYEIKKRNALLVVGKRMFLFLFLFSDPERAKCVLLTFFSSVHARRISYNRCIITITFLRPLPSRVTRFCFSTVDVFGFRRRTLFIYLFTFFF